MAIFDEYLIPINEKEYRDLAGLIYHWSGINLGSDKKELVKGRLLKRIRYYGFKSFKDYFNYVAADKHGDELVHLLDAISTNVTSFFREAQHFDILTEKVLPQLAAKKGNDKKIRVWSAGCSSGEEVYSISITLKEYFQEIEGWDIKVLGTDLSTQALARAKEGVYKQEQVKTVPRWQLYKYFTEQQDDRKRIYTVKDVLREGTAFARLNLIDAFFPFTNKPDIIFCRNVMIYFDRAMQHDLLYKFYRYLSDTGYLFLGHAEILLARDSNFKDIAPAVYQKRV